MAIPSTISTGPKLIGLPLAFDVQAASNPIPSEPATGPTQYTKSNLTPVQRQALLRYKAQRITIVSVKRETASYVTSSTGQANTTQYRGLNLTTTQLGGTAVTSGSTNVMFDWRILRGGIAPITTSELIELSGDDNIRRQVAAQQASLERLHIENREKAEGLRNTGGGLIIAGLLVFIAGDGMMIAALEPEDSSYHLNRDPWLPIGGAVALAGLSVFIPGVVIANTEDPPPPERTEPQLSYDQAFNLAELANARLRKELNLPDHADSLLEE